MIRNDQSAPSDAPDVDCDVLVVGGGPAGIVLAMELESSGLNVVLLESGGEEFDGRAQELNEGSLTALDTTDLSAARLRMFGGATNHWGGHCLPLDEIDFSRSPLSGMSGWPFGFAELLEDYVVASRYCDVGEMDYSLDTIPSFDRDDLLVSDPGLETKVIRQSTPTNFGSKYMTAFGASKNVDVRFWMTVTALDIDSDGLVKSVTARGIEGGAVNFRAKHVVLACGAVENARILLANNAQLGASFGNQSGLLGACYMDHPVGGAAFLHFRNPVTEKANWAHGYRSNDDIPVHFVWRLSDEELEKERLNNTQFFVLPLSDNEEKRLESRRARTGLNGLKSLAKWVLGRDQRNFELSTSYCDFIQNADSLAVHSLANLRGGEKVERVLLRYESEQQPTRDNYVALDPNERDMFGMPRAVLNWSPSLDDRDSIVRSAIRIGAIAGKHDIGRIELEDHFDTRYWDANTAWHQLGTTRMSVSPGDGIVDPNAKVHGTKNLFVTGGSVFPSGGRANPTLTIVALSVRLARHLRAERGV